MEMLLNPDQNGNMVENSIFYPLAIKDGNGTSLIQVDDFPSKTSIYKGLSPCFSPCFPFVPIKSSIFRRFPSLPCLTPEGIYSKMHLTGGAAR